MVKILKKLFRARSAASYFVAPETSLSIKPSPSRVNRKQALARAIDAAGSGWDYSFTAGLSALEVEELREIFADSHYNDPTLTHQ